MPRETERLELSRPTPADVAELDRIYSDPRVWTHYPSLRHTREDETVQMLGRWSAGWERDGLDQWVLRLRGSGAVVGHAGCSLRAGTFWNLGYRLAADPDPAVTRLVYADRPLRPDELAEVLA